MNRRQQRRYQGWVNDRRQNYWSHRHDRRFLMAEQRRLRAMRARYRRGYYDGGGVTYVVPYGQQQVVFIQHYEQVDPLLQMISTLLVVLLEG